MNMALSSLSPSVKILFVLLYLSPLDGDAVCADDDLRVAADADAAAGALHARVHCCVLLRRPDRRLRRGVDNRVVRLVVIGGGATGYRARARHVCKGNGEKL